MDNKKIYLDIDVMRQLLTPDAFAVYMADMKHSVYIVLTNAGTFHYEVCDSITGETVWVFHLTETLNIYYTKAGVWNV